MMILYIFYVHIYRRVCAYMKQTHEITLVYICASSLSTTACFNQWTVVWNILLDNIGHRLFGMDATEHHLDLPKGLNIVGHAAERKTSAVSHLINSGITFSDWTDMEMWTPGALVPPRYNLKGAPHFTSSQWSQP